MRVLFSLVLAIVVSGVCMGQSQTPVVKLYGKVNGVEIKEHVGSYGSYADDLHLDITFTLKNESNQTIIFIDKKPFITKVSLLNINLGHIDKVSKPRFSLTLEENEWKKTKSDLDKNVPPEDKTFILQPGESKQFGGVLVERLWQKSRGASLFEGVALGFNIEEVKEMLPVHLKYEIETWEIPTPIVRGKPGLKDKEKFENKLRKKWSKVGYLYTGSVISEPILLDSNLFNQ